MKTKFAVFYQCLQPTYIYYKNVQCKSQSGGVVIHLKQNDLSGMASVQSSKSPGLGHVQADVALMMIVKKCISAAMSQDVIPAKNPLSQVCRLS